MFIVAIANKLDHYSILGYIALLKELLEFPGNSKAITFRPLRGLTPNFRTSNTITL